MRIIKHNMLWIFLFSTHFFSACEHIVTTPLLQTLLDDMKLYKLDAENAQYLHAGDLYEHSIWTYNAMVELLNSDLPYVYDLRLTERQKEIVALAALLHDIGKAGRKELFDHTHPMLHYDVVKNNDGSVASITYYQDHQEHPRICFEYAAIPLKEDSIHRIYYLINKKTGELVALDMAQLYMQLGVTYEEQQIIAILLGIHYEFGNFKHGKITAAQFLTLLEKLVQEVDYNNGNLDEYIVKLAILIQVADVKGLMQVPLQATPLFPEGVSCKPTHEPTKFADAFVELDYVRPTCCCCHDDLPWGVQAMHNLLDYFHTDYQEKSLICFEPVCI